MVTQRFLFTFMLLIIFAGLGLSCNNEHQQYLGDASRFLSRLEGAAKELEKAAEASPEQRPIKAKYFKNKAMASVRTGYKSFQEQWGAEQQGKTMSTIQEAHEALLAAEKRIGEELESGAESELDTLSSLLREETEKVDKAVKNARYWHNEVSNFRTY